MSARLPPIPLKKKKNPITCCFLALLYKLYLFSYIILIGKQEKKDVKDLRLHCTIFSLLCKRKTVDTYNFNSTI